MLSENFYVGISHIFFQKSIVGDGMSSVMQELHNDPLVNQEVMNGPLYPKSNGAAEYADDRNCKHPKPEHISSTFCLGNTLPIAFTHLAWIGPNKGLKINHDSLVQNICFLLHLLLRSFTLKTFKF